MPPRHIQLAFTWPERYFAGLTKPMKKKREKELLKRRRVPYSKLRLGQSNKAATKRKSKWTLQFHKVYPGLKFNKEAIARRTGISRSTLNTVYDRGLKAWKTGGSRPGATAPQWAIARVYKYVLVTKKKAPKAWYATRADPNQNLRLY
jgi:lambda repressor-like predicted transcriptional regulator